MTRTVRTPARLLKLTTSDLLAEGTAVIWSDLGGWGGIFEPNGGGDSLRTAATQHPVIARLQTQDGRSGVITLAPSQFVADSLRPLTFIGQGEIDSAHDKAMSIEIGSEDET